jgi:hypothetical protein
MLALALLFTAPGATAADMSWPIMNNSRFKIEIQFYSRARNLVWPGYGQVWYAWPGQSDHRRLCAAFLAITSATALGRRAISTASGASAAMAGKGARAAASTASTDGSVDTPSTDRDR